MEYCNHGRRGIFCSAKGIPLSSDTPLTTDEMNTNLGPFSLILSPQSLELLDHQLQEYSSFVPLAEYSNAYGIVYKTSDSS